MPWGPERARAAKMLRPALELAVAMILPAAPTCATPAANCCDAADSSGHVYGNAGGIAAARRNHYPWPGCSARSDRWGKGRCPESCLAYSLSQVDEVALERLRPRRVTVADGADVSRGRGRGRRRVDPGGAPPREPRATAEPLELLVSDSEVRKRLRLALATSEIDEGTSSICF